ncbi:WD40-repeat-containing domain protein [Tricharina praecox]|uniref:WD40-repeat-containing domain protein n=1 Tax=Tricharina praecox TaxID=43433 RepID=UPI00221F7C13|nr:WD40-repeat-containing domain protein [Tricharina praecox]KAI5848271.1 WD40-repeat-containing domain protein [Tricharina praecox]
MTSPPPRPRSATPEVQSQTWPHITSPPRLVASTGTTYSGSIAATSDCPTRPDASESNLFKSLQWTSDGSTLLTHSEDGGLRTFILPPDILSPTLTPLTPYCTTFLPHRIYATALYPSSSLSTPSTLLYLASSRGGPIRLHSLLHPTLLASYPLINAHTESYLTPHSLLIPPHRPHTFIAGSASSLSFFDLHRAGSAPVRTLRTIPTRRSPATTVTMKGLITALALGGGGGGAGGGVLAAATNTRQVGLYAGDGKGEVVGVFGLPKEPRGEAGGGVTQLEWSKCERYLFIAERRSEVVTVYDIRNTGRRVGSLMGRGAATNQRVGVSVAHALGGEVLGGGMDGMVRVWEGEEGGEAVGGWRAHEDVVTAAVVHPFDTDTDAPPWDNSLKIWEVPRAHTHSSPEDREP